MNPIILPVAIIMLMVSSCAGTGAKPVRVYQINDSSLSCSQIESEAENILKTFKINEEQQSSIRKRNITAYISGQLLLIPTLWMDVTGSKQIERKALFMRLERLRDLSEAKDC